VKNPLFSSGQVAERTAVKMSLEVSHWTVWYQKIKKIWDELSLDYIMSLIDALPALVEKVIVMKGNNVKGHKKLIIKLQSSYLHLC
jgi:hypothetical protein